MMEKEDGPIGKDGIIDNLYAYKLFATFSILLIISLGYINKFGINAFTFMFLLMSFFGFCFAFFWERKKSNRKASSLIEDESTGKHALVHKSFAIVSVLLVINAIALIYMKNSVTSFLLPISMMLFFFVFFLEGAISYREANKVDEKLMREHKSYRVLSNILVPISPNFGIIFIGILFGYLILKSIINSF